MRGITRITTLQTMTSKKGTLAAKEAAKKAAATRLANRIAAGWEPKAIRKIKGDKAKIVSELPKKPLNIKFIKPAVTPKISIQPIRNNVEVKDQEEMVIFTDGPTKITYSSAYNTIKVTPHTVKLVTK